MKPRNLVLGAAVVLVALPIAALRHWDKPKLELVGTAAAIDGDTIDMHGVRIRLFGIDAPEHGQLCTDPGNVTWTCGTAATIRLAALIKDRALSCIKQDTDRYGRIVAICTSGEIDAGQEMVRAGLAIAYRRYSSVYVDDEIAARLAKRGIWHGTFTEPEQWRRAQR